MGHQNTRLVFVYVPTLWKTYITPVEDSKVESEVLELNLYQIWGVWVRNQALQINVKEKAEHENHLNCLMKMWICADFADPLTVKAPSPAGAKIHEHLLKFPLIVLLKPAVTDLWSSISQNQYV